MAAATAFVGQRIAVLVGGVSGSTLVVEGQTGALLKYLDPRVVEALPEVNPALRAAFDVAYEKRPSAPGKRAANDRALSMPGRFKGTVGLLRWTDTGGLEIEVFDFSEQAHASFGGDIANIYTVAAQDLPKLAERLAYGFGGEVAPIEQLPESLSCFLCVESLVEWLTQNSEVPFAKRVDFDA